MPSIFTLAHREKGSGWKGLGTTALFSVSKSFTESDLTVRQVREENCWVVGPFGCSPRPPVGRLPHQELSSKDHLLMIKDTVRYQKTIMYYMTTCMKNWYLCTCLFIWRQITPHICILVSNWKIFWVLWVSPGWRRRVFEHCSLGGLARHHLHFWK